MAILTHAVLLTAAMQCVSPIVAPIIAGIVEHENPRRDTMAVHHNTNGTTDYGLGQINSSNFPLLSRLFGRQVNAESIRSDVCLNLRSAQAILFIRYNGNPTPAAGAAYAAGAIRSVDAVRIVETTAPPETLADKAPATARDGKDQPPPSWDVWGLEVWRRQHADADKPKEPK